MPIFGKKFDFLNDALPPERSKHRHLERMLKPGVAIARPPEMKPGTSVVILPYPNFGNPNYKRENDVLDDRNEDTRFNPWIFYAPGMNKWGKSPVSMLFDNPDDAGWSPYEEHPAYLVYGALFNAVKNKTLVPTPFGTSDSDKWNVLLDGDGGNVYACVDRPKMQFVCNVLIYSSNNDNYVLDGSPPLGAADNDQQVVFVMTKGTTEDLLEKVDAVGADEKFLYDNFTGCKFIHFFDKKLGTCAAMQAAEAAKRASTGGFGGNRRAPSGPMAAKKNEGFGYGTYVSDTLSGRPAGQSEPELKRADAAKLACAKLKPWEDVLRGHTPAECAHVIANECGLPESLLYHAWKSRPEFYSDSIKTRLKNPVSANFPPAPTVGTTTTTNVPDGTTFPPDGGDLGAPPVPDGTQGDDDQDIYNPDKLREAQERFRQMQQNQPNTRPGGTKPPSRR